MRRNSRREREHLTEVMRAAGRTWVEVAETLREENPVNARVAMRWAHGWSQQDVAEGWCDRWPDEPKTLQNISTWECWPLAGHQPSLVTLIRLAEIYECAAADLVADLGDFRHLDSANDPTMASLGRLLVTDRASDVVDEASEAASYEATDRRTFTKSAVLSVLGLNEPLQRLLAADAQPRRTIGPEHVHLVETALESIERRDAAIGGSGLLDGAVALHDQVTDWLHGRSYTLSGVGDELQALLGDICAWTGWLAVDADQPALANRYLAEALVHARLTDDPALEVRALNYICLLTRDRRPREALQCAQAAQRLSAGWATPRLRALLHLRAARSHATLGEGRAFGREMAKARAQLDHGPSPDDPLYIHFVTPPEVSGITGLSQLAMGHCDRAATEFRNITEFPDPTYRRNVGYYTVRLAEATARQHDIGGASEIALDAIPLVAGMQSERTSRILGNLRTALGTHRATSPLARDFADAYDEAFT